MSKRTPIAAGLFAAITASMFSVSPASAVTNFSEWDYDMLSTSWELSNLMEGAVYSRDDQLVGWVEDVIFDNQGYLQSVVVETGSALHKSGQYFEIAWPKVDLDPALYSVKLKSSVDEINEMSTSESHHEFDEAGQWRGSELLSFTVNLDGMAPFGTVRDVMMSDDSKVDAYLVNPDGAEEDLYALPFDYNLLGNAPRIDLPYTEDMVLDLEPYIAPTS